MKSKIVLFSVFFVFYGSILQAQDTIIEYNNYKWKVGTKFISEKSIIGYSFIDPLIVQNFGISINKKLKIHKISLESGFYKITRATDQPFIVSYYGQYPHGASMPFYFHHISIPINISYETRLFYFTGGTYLEFLIDETSDLNTSNKDMVVSIPHRINDRKFNYGVNLNIGLEKSINKYFNFIIEGRLSHNLLVNSNHYPEYKFSNIGYALGVNYKFLN